MNRIHKQRITYIVLSSIGLSIALALILYALKQNINVFVTPQQLIKRNMPHDYQFRLGGLVKKDSILRDKNGLGVHFIITDTKNEINVYYSGILPDLFREDKGVIAEGHLNTKNIFIANQVLAKHDENYMPKNVYKAMRNSVS